MTKLSSPKFGKHDTIPGRRTRHKDWLTKLLITDTLDKKHDNLPRYLFATCSILYNTTLALIS